MLLDEDTMNYAILWFAEMKCSVIIGTILSMIVVTMITDRVMGMPRAQCDPALLEDAPPRIRKVCMALSTIYELGSAMENYIDDKGTLNHSILVFW